MKRSLELLNQLHIQIVLDYMELKATSPALAEEWWAGMRPCIEVAVEVGQDEPRQQQIQKLTRDIDALFLEAPRPPSASPAPGEAVSTRKRGGGR